VLAEAFHPLLVMPVLIRVPPATAGIRGDHRVKPQALNLRASTGFSICVMAGPSGRAYGPPKGMLVPATHDFACFNTASRGWPRQARP
jgi:hypothetical protein